MILGFELGNELNVVLNGSIGAKAQANDFQTVNNLMKIIWRDAEKFDFPKVNISRYIGNSM